MRKYFFIIRNSYLEANLSFGYFLLAIIYRLIQISGLILLYSFVIGANGLSKEIIIYFLFTLVVSGGDFQRLAYAIRDDIRAGDYLNIDKLPINSYLYYSLKSFGSNIAVISILEIVSIITLIIFKYDFVGIILFIPATLIGIFLGYLIYYMVGISTFYNEFIDITLFNIIFDFLSGKLVPLSFLPSALLNIFLSFMPFVYTSGALARNFSQYNLNGLFIGLGISLMWSIFLFWLGNKLWNKGGFRFQEGN